MGNLHLRFDEGRVGRGLPSLSLLLYRLGEQWTVLLLPRLSEPHRPPLVAQPRRHGRQ